MHRGIDYLTPAARRVLLFFNPTAGAKSRQSPLAQCVSQLQATGFDVEMISDPAHLTEIARTPDPSRRAVIAAGGDGTVSMVANCTPPGTPIAVLPLGTENLLAKYINSPKVAATLAACIQRGATVRIDAGEANGKMFVLMAGCGFDADVVQRLHAARRGHIHHMSYIKPILASIRTYEYPALHVWCGVSDDVPDGGRRPMIPWPPDTSAPEGRLITDVRWVFIVNLPRYAGGLNFVPGAVGHDGQLDVCTFRHGSLFRGLRYLWGVARGRHLSWPDVTYCRARVIRVESHQPAAYQLDGDPGGMLPVDIRVLPARLRLVVDPEWAVRHGFVEM